MWDEIKVGEEMLLLFTLQGEAVVQEKRRPTVRCWGPPETASTQSCIMRPLAVYNMLYKKKSPIRDHKMYVFCNMFGFFITVVMKFTIFLLGPDESSLCLLKGGRISGFTMAHAELPVLHDQIHSAGFDLIGPYSPVPKSVDSNVKKEFFMLCLKKILCGFPKATPPIDEEAADERTRYSVDMLCTNPEHPMGNPMFAMLCPSHQVTSFF